MTNEEKLLTKRLAELHDRAERRYTDEYSDFLSLAEQSLLPAAVPGEDYVLFGGFEGAERCLACFGEDAAERAPISCLRVSPTSEKFADALTHRDFLGSLMSLGIKRETLGDILIFEGSAYILCLEGVSDFILRNLDRIRRTTVRVSREASPPPDALPKPAEQDFIVASERLDALVAAVYKLSRSESQRLFTQGRIFINGKLCENPSATAHEGEIISVRGHGRFEYKGESGQTRKGRLKVTLAVYR